MRGVRKVTIGSECTPLPFYGKLNSLSARGPHSDPAPPPGAQKKRRDRSPKRPTSPNPANQIIKPLDKPQWIVAQWPLSTHTIPGYIWLVLSWLSCRSNSIAPKSHGHQEPKTKTVWRILNFTRNKIKRPSQNCLTSLDSGLEAFSLNPTDGSFAALAFLLTTFTNCLNKLFLSY